MALSDEQKRAIDSWRNRPSDSKPQSTTPAYTSPPASEPLSQEATSSGADERLAKIKAKLLATRADLTTRIGSHTLTLNQPNSADGSAHWRARNELAHLTQSRDDIDADIADIETKIYAIRGGTPPSGPSTRPIPTTPTPTTPTPTSSTVRRDRPRSHRSLYLTILSALLGFNIFRSLFGRESVAIECGSWFFPVRDEAGNPVGFFTSGAARACPRYIAGTLTEAVVSAVALAAVAATLYFTRESN